MLELQFNKKKYFELKENSYHFDLFYYNLCDPSCSWCLRGSTGIFEPRRHQVAKTHEAIMVDKQGVIVYIVFFTQINAETANRLIYICV